MSKDFKYTQMSDEDIMRETTKRLQEMKRLLGEIRDALKSAGSME